MATRQWHYVQDGRQAGPVAEDALKRMIATGTVRSSDLIWTEGFAEWRPAGQVPEFSTRPTATAGGVEMEPSSPYAAPKVQVSSASYDGDGNVVTAGIKRALAETRPWVLFMSILIFIGCGLAGIGTLAALFISPIFGIVYLPFIALYFFAGYHLFNYANGIKTFLRTSRDGDLQSALTAQKSFWKLVGIVTAVGFALWIAGFLFAIVAGARF
jgi:hypothetical protein